MHTACTQRTPQEKIGLFVNYKTCLLIDGIDFVRNEINNDNDDVP